MTKQVGTKPYQTPRNADLGTLAYQDVIPAATLHATMNASSRAAILANNDDGYVGFDTLSSSSDNWFEYETTGIVVRQSGLVTLNFTQDFKSTLPNGYLACYILINGSLKYRHLARHSHDETDATAEWDSIVGNFAEYCEAGTKIDIRYLGNNNIVDMDTGAWSHYTFLWIAQ